MKKVLLNLIVLFVLASLSSCGYNTMVDKEEEVSNQWAKVQSAYQRRADLIPNLARTVTAASEEQRRTLKEVMEARAKATSVNLNVENLTPENIQKYQDAQQGLTSALSRLMAVSESYPKVDIEQYKMMMFELEQTENRIGVERNKFNQAVKEYNAYIRKFPNNMTASMFDFEKKGYFEAEKGSEKAPSVFDKQ